MNPVVEKSVKTLIQEEYERYTKGYRETYPEVTRTYGSDPESEYALSLPGLHIGELPQPMPFEVWIEKKYETLRQSY